jgi:hypothetical protein
MKVNRNKIKLDDMFCIYCEEFNLYDKNGLSTVVKGVYRTKKDGKRVYYLKDAYKLEPTYYVKGSWQAVRNYMYNKVMENRATERGVENEIRNNNNGSFSVA